MVFNKEFHFFSHMPLRSVYIDPNFVPLQMLIEVLQASDKTLAISLRGPDQPLSTQQRSHPPKDVEPITMLTGSRDSQPFPLLAPSHTQTRMQRESCFILKYNGLVRLQGSEFFLRPYGIAQHPPSALAFEHFHHMGRRVFRRHRHIHVYMIRSYCTFKDINV